MNNQERSEAQMGECRVCGRSFMLLKDGSVRRHADKRRGVWPPSDCEGAWHLPVAASSGGVS